VSQLSVAGENVSGRDFRGALQLPSTNFTWRVEGEQVVFTVRGHGHGVGLCQYGADGMARAGKTFREIINFYYTDVSVESLRR
jgi:stage II sporulation protein D